MWQSYSAVLCCKPGCNGLVVAKEPGYQKVAQLFHQGTRYFQVSFTDLCFKANLFVKIFTLSVSVFMRRVAKSVKQQLQKNVIIKSPLPREHTSPLASCIYCKVLQVWTLIISLNCHVLDFGNLPHA